MNSSKYCILLLFLVFFSVNAFAEFHFQMNWAEITTTANPNGPPDGPSPLGVNAYYGKDGVYAGHQVLEDTDWIMLEFELVNLSTNASGEPRPVSNFDLRIESEGVSAPNPEYSYQELYDNGFTDSRAIWIYNAVKVFRIAIPVNSIQPSPQEFQIQDLAVYIRPPAGSYLYLSDPFSGHAPDVEVHNQVIIPPAEVHNDIHAYLDRITCYDPSNPSVEAPGANPYDYGVMGPNWNTNPIRCDLVDSNTITYDIVIEDINAQHNPATGNYVEIEYFNLSCNTEPYANRTMHYSDGCPEGTSCWYSGIQYNGFPAACEFLHYGSVQPGHSDCRIYGLPSWPVAGGWSTGFAEYSTPTDFSMQIPNCGTGFAPGCPEQDKNIYYNSNGVSLRKYLGADSSDLNFTLFFGDRKTFKGTITNARTGGDFKCSGSLYYTLRDPQGNVVGGVENERVPLIVGGSNTGALDGTINEVGGYFAKLIKLKGHEAYVVKDGGRFMASSPFVRPLVPFRVELPVKNTGLPWDGTTEKDILYVDVNIYTTDWYEFIGKSLVIDGSDSDHTLNTDEEKLFFVEFPVPEGLYHQFLNAATMRARLYDMNGWIYDFTLEAPIKNVRLITVLNPMMHQILGDACYTDPLWDDFCWWNYINYVVTPVDLNANDDIDLILRLRNPFDFNEFFDLTYETNNPGNARLDFDPSRNFIPPFTAGEFGYRYSSMVLSNPRILHGDANYNVVTTSVNHPFVWDNLDAQFRTFSNNLKIESFTISPEQENYSLGDELDFSLIIRNGSDRPLYDVNFLVVSSMDPTIIYHAGNGIDLVAGATQEITGTLPAIPYKGVFVVEATVQPVNFEFNLSDNQKVIYISTGYEGNVSNLPEINYSGLLLVLVIVLFMVRKK